MACSWGDTEEFARLASSTKMPIPRDLLMAQRAIAGVHLVRLPSLLYDVIDSLSHENGMMIRCTLFVVQMDETRISPKLSGGSDEPRRANYHLSCIEAHP